MARLYLILHFLNCDILIIIFRKWFPPKNNQYLSVKAFKMLIQSIEM